jgi:quinolinate synthase
MDMSLKDEIMKLKKERNAVILSHFYEDSEIQDIADEIGDSYFLAKKGRESTADVIVLCGVVFMGESVKLLNPEKTVLVPDMNAGCSLVDGAPFEAYKKWREDNNKAICVTYINSSAEVKAISDVICTSSNAAKIVEAIPKDRQILFGPDKNLGRWLSKKLKRDMTFWQGACEVHIQFSLKRLVELKTLHPEAVVLAHPECEDELLQLADVIGSTSQLLEAASDSSKSKFIVATEPGIIHQMKRANPEANFIPLPGIDESCACNDCPYMKLNTLEKLRNCLRDLSPSINLDQCTKEFAQQSLVRMMDISEGKPVDWPKEFQAPV